MKQCEIKEANFQVKMIRQLLSLQNSRRNSTHGSGLGRVRVVPRSENMGTSPPKLSVLVADIVVTLVVADIVPLITSSPIINPLPP